ncbi:hypothetical protein Tco_0455212, partial [Tanacetum coccineum]
IPVIVLSDDDSDVPVTIKRRRLVKNGAIVKKNYVQDEPKAKKHKAILNKGRMANNNDVDMTFLDKKKELPIKKAYGKEVQKIDNVKANDESPIWFNTDKKKKPCFVTKSPAMNLIDEPTDEEFSDSVDFNKDFVNLFDDQANDDAKPNPETLTEATKDFPSLDGFADATAEDLYDSDMYSVRSVSDGDNFINDDGTPKNSNKRKANAIPAMIPTNIAPLVDFSIRKAGRPVTRQPMTQDYLNHGDPNFPANLVGHYYGMPRLLEEQPMPWTSHIQYVVVEVRRYNSMFAFTSMGGKVDDTVNYGRGLFCYCIHGENYHRVGSLLPGTGLAIIMSTASDRDLD